MIEHSLLLLHSTIYGSLSPLTTRELSNKTPNIDQWNDPDYDWRDGLFEVRSVTMAAMNGPATDTAPVEMIHWNAGSGQIGLSPLAHWRNCIKLLRHV